MSRWTALVLGGLGGLALLAAACAPASEPATTTTTTTTTTTEKPAETKATTEKPAETKATTTTAKPAETKATTTTAKPAETKAKVSVSGIPLDPAAKRGGTLTRAYYQEGPTYSSWEEKTNVWAESGQPVTNNLIRLRTWGSQEEYAKAAYFELAPDLAASWEQSADGLQWIFKLRDGVKFSDGTTFSCQDAKWSLDTIRTGEGLRRSVLATQFLPIDQIQCADSQTLVVRLKRPKPALADLLGVPHNVMVPKAKYEGNTEELRTKPTIGTGPFRLKEYFVQEKYVLERRGDYWDQPFPYLDGIDMIFLAQTAIPAALRAGRVDWGAMSTGFRGGQYDTLKKECTSCTIWPQFYGVFPGITVIVNQQRPPWNDPLIKDAISLAIDRAKFAALLQVAPPDVGPFYPGSFWAMPYERVKEIPGYNLQTPEDNKKRARDLLAQAGYKPGELIMPLDIGVYNNTHSPPIIEDLEAVGFKVQATQQEVGRTYEKYTSAEFEVITASFAGAGVDPDFNLYEFYYTGSDRNAGRWSNLEYDRLVDLQSITVDREERRRLAWDAAEIAWREHAMISLGGGVSFPVHSGRLRGWMPTPVFAGAMRFDHAYLD